MVMYGNRVGSGGAGGDGQGSQSLHTLSQRTRKKGRARNADLGGVDAEAARGDGGGGIFGDGGEVGVTRVEAMGREFAIRLDRRQREEAAAGAGEIRASRGQVRRLYVSRARKHLARVQRD